MCVWWEAGGRRRLQGAGLGVLPDQEVGATGLIEGGAGVKIEGAEVIVHGRGGEDVEAKAEAGRDLRRTRMDTDSTWQVQGGGGRNHGTWRKGRKRCLS